MNDSYESGYMPTPIEAMRIYWKERVRRRFSVLAALFLVMAFCCSAYFYMDYGDAVMLLNHYEGINASLLYTAAAEGSKSASAMNEKAQKPAKEQVPVITQEPAQTQEPVATQAPVQTQEPEREESVQGQERFSGRALPFALHRGYMTNPETVFFNNLTACIIIVMLGMIPFLPLSALTLPANAALLAAGVIVLSRREGSIVPGLCGMLPHGILKAAALVLSAALGSLLSREIGRGILHRTGARPMHALGMTVMLFAVIVIPLLLATAAVEFWVSPEVYMWAVRGGLGG